MIRIVAGFFIVMVMISVGTVYSLKEATRQLLIDKQRLSANILKDRAAIKVLRAEMAYLSQPERLQKLSRRFLALSPALPYQMAKSVTSLAVRGSSEKITTPVDEFPLLLPQKKPVIRERAILAPQPIRKTGFYDPVISGEKNQ